MRFNVTSRQPVREGGGLQMQQKYIVCALFGNLVKEEKGNLAQGFERNPAMIDCNH